MAWSMQKTLGAIKEVHKAPNDSKSVLLTLSPDADAWGIITLLSANLPDVENSHFPVIELAKRGAYGKSLQTPYPEKESLRLTFPKEVGAEIRFFRVINGRTIGVKIEVE